MAISQGGYAGSAIGDKGSDYISDTSTHAADLNAEGTEGTPATYLYHSGFPFWRILYAVTDCTLASDLVLHENHPGTSLPSGAVITAGQYIHGKFTEIDLTSGTMIAYR